MERYSLEKAQEEAKKIQDRIKIGEVKSYDEAERLLDEKQPNFLNNPSEPVALNERGDTRNFKKLTEGAFRRAYQDFSLGILEAAPWAQTKSVPGYFVRSLNSDWFQEYVNQNPGKQLIALDVGCGVGDISRDLQKFGFRVTAIDYEQAAIDEANKKSADFPDQPSPHYLVGNALDLDAVLLNAKDNQFDLAYEFSLIHHLDPETRKPYIKGIADHLLPGGKFAVTCFTDTDTIAKVDKVIDYVDNGTVKKAKFSEHEGKGVPTFLLSESEIREAAQDWFRIDYVEYIDIVRLDKEGNKLPVAKRIEVLMTKK